MNNTLSSDAVISHWDVLRENTQVSVQDLYSSIEAGLSARNIPGASASRVELAEGGFGSPKRQYLRVQRDQLLFDVSAGPFGTGFFVSWWLVNDRLVLSPIARMFWIFAFFASLLFFSIFLTPIFGPFVFAGVLLAWLASVSSQAANGTGSDRFVEALPIVGWIYRRVFKILTYYRIDTTLAFQSAVHGAVVEAVEALGVEKGLRALSDKERAPVMKDFFTRLR